MLKVKTASLQVEVSVCCAAIWQILTSFPNLSYLMLLLVGFYTFWVSFYLTQSCAVRL